VRLWRPATRHNSVGTALSQLLKAATVLPLTLLMQLPQRIAGSDTTGVRSAGCCTSIFSVAFTVFFFRACGLMQGVAPMPCQFITFYASCPISNGFFSASRLETGFMPIL